MRALDLVLFVVFSAGSALQDALTFKVRAGELAVGSLVAAIVKLALTGADRLDTIAGLCAGGALFYAIYRLSRGGLGAGDVRFSAFMGLALGFRAWDLAVIAGSALGAAWIVAARAIEGRRGGSRRIGGLRIPFTPFLFAGSILVAALGGIAL